MLRQCRRAAAARRFLCREQIGPQQTGVRLRTRSHKDPEGLENLVRGERIDGRRIKVRQLLRHTSGLPDYVGIANDIREVPHTYFEPRELLDNALARNRLHRRAQGATTGGPASRTCTPCSTRPAAPSDRQPGRDAT
ncbi:MAG: hypothetical protein ABW215_07175 [Kibdelosporangium sp.]